MGCCFGGFLLDITSGRGFTARFLSATLIGASIASRPTTILMTLLVKGQIQEGNDGK